VSIMDTVRGRAERMGHETSRVRLVEGGFKFRTIVSGISFWLWTEGLSTVRCEAGPRLP